MRIAIALGAVALTLTPAALVAQDMAKPDMAKTDMAKPEVPPPPSAPSPMETEVPPSTPAPPSSPAPTVADKVAADWSKYDMGAKGHLTKTELSRWLGDLRTSNGEPAPDAKWLDSAFAQTDGNKDMKISKEELTTSLSGGR